MGVATGVVAAEVLSSFDKSVADSLARFIP